MKLFMNIGAVVLVLVLWSSGVGAAAQQVPCFFIFGDSLVDNGNNNRLTSLAKANYAPYGIDFPRGPTGRFSNGKTTADVIGEIHFIMHAKTCFLLSTYVRYTNCEIMIISF